MGYAEAKWAREQMLAHLGETFSDECMPMIVRIGQLSGPEHGGDLEGRRTHSSTDKGSPDGFRFSFPH